MLAVPGQKAALGLELDVARKPLEPLVERIDAASADAVRLGEQRVDARSGTRLPTRQQDAGR
jgi:hypothetical protein